MAADKDTAFVPGRVGIVGLGLIGGSFARAWHAAGNEVFAWNRTKEILYLARIDTVDGALDDETIPTCELIVLTTYPEHCVAWLRENADKISPGAIVIDTCGIKRQVCEECWAIAEGRPWHFVGAHPMAGTQFSGYAHSRADLFQGAPMVLCPDLSMDDVEGVDLMHRLVGLLRPCGFARFSVISPEEHDAVIAHTSQLAHVVSNAYVKSPRAQNQKGFSAGSWRDLTRVAQLNPTMWTELFMDNADNLIGEIDHITAELTRYRDALATGDATELHRLLKEGSDLKKEADAR